MTLEKIVKQRGITEILHFTTNEGLLGILYTRMVKSRKRLPKEKKLEYIFRPNAIYRKDPEWLDYVNLSISRINSKFFKISSESWHKKRDIWWCVLSFDPIILSHSGVYFATTNNMYDGVQHGIGIEGFEALFTNTITQWPGKIVRRKQNQPDKYPTCKQAEVLYPEELSTEFLKRVYAKNGNDKDEIFGQYAGVGYMDIEVQVKPEIFEEE